MNKPTSIIKTVKVVNANLNTLKNYSNKIDSELASVRPRTKKILSIDKAIQKKLDETCRLLEAVINEHREPINWRVKMLEGEMLAFLRSFKSQLDEAFPGGKYNRSYPFPQ